MGNCSGLRRLYVGKAIWLAGALLCVGAPATAVAGPLTFEQRVQAQGALDRVAYAHRLWPQATSRPEPSFEALFPEDVRRRRVEEYLAKSAALASYWQRPLTAEQLQAEIDRMVRSSKAPDVLGEMFAALNEDPHLIAECLARPILADRLARQWYAHDPRFQGDGKFEDWLHDHAGAAGTAGIEDTVTLPFRLPRLAPTVGADNTWSPMTQMPAERLGHTLVWTGTEMIVWGGSASPAWSSYPLKSGGRYNPATDTWSLTSQVNAPSARLAHSAVWTGTEMIVWGGASGVYLTTGGRYDPSTDTWTATAPPPATIEGRTGHSTVWTGTEMIIWGGLGPAGVGTSGGRYNPATNTWTATPASGLSARYNHSAVWTGAEMVVWGGHDYAMGYFNDGRRYSPATNTWAAVAAATIAPRYSHSAVWTGTEMIVWGGSSTVEYQNGARYDPSTDTWATTSLVGAPAPQGGMTAVWTGTRMLVAGGRYDPSTNIWTSMSPFPAGTIASFQAPAVWTGSEMIVWGGAWTVSGLGARYSPTSDSWVPTATSSAPTARTNHTAVWTGTEMVVWEGDANADPNSYYDSGGRYSPATDAWIPTSSSGAPSARSRGRAVWTGSEMLVWGGCDAVGCSNAGGRYDPVADGWTPMSVVNAPAGRLYLTAVWTGAEMIVWGGYDIGSPEPYVNTGGRYNPASDTWTPTSVANAPSVRAMHTAVWTGAEMIVWGGNTGGGPANTGGRYDPVADGWTATSLVGAPDARPLHTSVWSGKEMIVWGGAGVSPLGSRYDPAANTWTPISALGAPSERYFHVGVWTGAEMIVWGGIDPAAGELLNSGGRYDPSSDSWSTTTTVGAPSPRQYLPAVWTGTEMLAWSGTEGSPTYTGGRYAPGIVLTPGVLPDGVQGVAYSRPLLASGGTGPYTFTVTTGSLPTGLTLSSAGLLSGIPDTAGIYSFTVTATDAASRTGSRAYSLTITPAADLSITVSDGGATPIWGGPLSYSLTVTNNGPGAVTGATVSDSFPAGLASVAWTCTASLGSACTAAGSGNLSDAAVALLPGGTVTYSAIGVVAYGTAGPLANTATVGSSAYDPVPANNSATVSTPVDGDLIFKDGFQGP